MSSNNDKTSKILIVAFSLCIICSVLVSGAAILLRPLQQMKNILVAAGMYKEGLTVEEQFKKIETKVIDFSSGEYTTEVDPAQYDQLKAAKDPKMNYGIPQKEDIGNIKFRAKFGLVYEYYEAEVLKTVILPIKAKGLWSTMLGFIAIDGSDLSTVKGFAFYQHGETPGLGGEVDNPNWKKQWVGKKVYDQDFKASVNIPKGAVNPTSSQAIHQVDGLSGATITSHGVEMGLNYWLGSNAYKAYIERLKNPKMVSGL
jgi:Na+-transporting NADH:ubiquinone oxidoreductase subunit C